MKRKTKHQERRPRPARPTPEPEMESLEALRELEAKREAGSILTGGDLDADWQRAASSGEEAVGGSVATPDQDVVDEIGEALGVPQARDAQVRTSGEILRERDRHYWDLERKASNHKRSS
jgi:uncharacterized protein DUF6335